MTANEMDDLSQLLNVHQDDANYIVNFSPRYSYIYVETPKVACSTIKRTLQLAEVDGNHSRVPKDVHARELSPLPMFNSRPDIFWSLYSEAATFRFCFVRNPFSRALSCYLDKFVQDEELRDIFPTRLGFAMGTKLSFRDFLLAVREQSDAERNVHWMRQSYLLQPERFHYSFIGRFESFQTHFDLVMERLGLPPVKTLRVAPHATSASNKIKSYYGAEEIALVQEIYARDFEAFGYGWSPDIL